MTAFTVDQTDSTGITDGSAAFNFGFLRTDSAGLTDTNVRFSYQELLTDSAGLTDTDVRFTGKLVTPTDDAGLSDAVFGFDVEDILTDSVGLTDPSDVTRTSFGQVFTDTAGLTDSTVFNKQTIFTSSLKVKVDWDHVGFKPTSTPPDFSSPDDDITALVQRERGAVELEYGRDQSTALAPTVAGRGSLTLDNSSRKFSPRNTASPLYGNIKPARPVRITRDGTTTGLYSDIYSDIYEDTSTVVYTLFRGVTDDSPINPDVMAKTVNLSLVDGLAYFRGVNITTQLYSGVRTGTAINHILDAAGWPTALRDLDAGATVIPYWWEDNTDALEALEKVLRSEGPPAMLTMGVNGEVIFLDRHHRLTNANSITSQATWSAYGGPEPVMNKPFSYDDAWRNIVNTGAAEIGIRQGNEQTAVWNSDSPITLTSGEQKVITASTSDPFINAVTPVLGTDYTVASGVVTVSLNRTSGSSVGIVLQAVGGPAVIATMQVRATPLPVSYSIQISYADTASVEDYGARSFPGDLPWCNQYDAEAVLSTAVAQRSQPIPVVSATFMVGRSEDRAALILSRDLSDRVHIVEPETALDDDFFIENIQHSLSGEHDHTVTFGLEAAPQQVLIPFTFDDDDAGFDEGYFVTAMDDPATMFTFDDDGVGFDEGVFAT